MSPPSAPVARWCSKPVANRRPSSPLASRRRSAPTSRSSCAQKKEIRALAAREPFDRKLVEALKGKLQVVLVSKRPPAKTQRDVLALATDEDRLAFGDRELYWLPSGGIRDSLLNFRALEKVLGPTTTRTKGTIDQLAAKYFRPA
jgi:uncharacterized protein (DUF1697 family)